MGLRTQAAKAALDLRRDNHLNDVEGILVGFQEKGWDLLTKDEISVLESFLAVALETMRRTDSQIVRNAAIVVEARAHTQHLREVEDAN